MKTVPDVEYSIVENADQIDVTNAYNVAIDLEMFGQDKDKLHIPHGEFACLALSLDNGKNYIITDHKIIGSALMRLISLQWIIQNATYDIRQLRRFTQIDRHFILDPMLLEKILWSGFYSTFSLASMARRYFGLYMEKDKYEQIRDRSIPLAELYSYAAKDTYMTLRVCQEQLKLLNQRRPEYLVYISIDEPMIWVVLDMPPARVNMDGWLTLAKENESKGKSIEEELGVNVFSYKKVKEMIAAKYGIGLANTEDETLAEYKHLPIIQKIREGRGYRKAVSTYGEVWLQKHATPPDGDVYCSWNVTGAATGRMSSDSPNLQNIPSRKMPVFRSLFIPRNGKYIIADVSQQEPRITALLSMDKNLINIFANHEDVHLMVTRMLFEDETIQKDDPRRKIGKEINLGIVYGLTAIGLLGRLKEVLDDPGELDEEKCQTYIDAYFNKFPRVKTMLDRAVQDGHRLEFTTTPYGRRAYLNIHAMGWENNCKNNPVQGGGADMTKAWMARLWEACRIVHLPFPVCMVIHDELVLDVPEDMLDNYVLLLKEAFKQAVELVFPGSPVPFEFEYIVGDNWGEKK